jgi:pantothenate kinase
VCIVDTEEAPLFPYLLVNIGSGVSMVKVDGNGQFERVSGTNLGGGTFWGLCRLLTGVKNFDEMLELSSQGDSANIDMLVGDIYGGKGYEDIGLSADMIACSFGKVISEDKDLNDFRPAGAKSYKSLTQVLSFAYFSMRYSPNPSVPCIMFMLSYHAATTAMPSASSLFCSLENPKSLANDTVNLWRGIMKFGFSFCLSSDLSDQMENPWSLYTRLNRYQPWTKSTSRNV